MWANEQIIGMLELRDADQTADWRTSNCSPRVDLVLARSGKFVASCIASFLALAHIRSSLNSVSARLHLDLSASSLRRCDGCATVTLIPSWAGDTVWPLRCFAFPSVPTRSKARKNSLVLHCARYPRGGFKACSEYILRVSLSEYMCPYPLRFVKTRHTSPPSPCTLRLQTYPIWTTTVIVTTISSPELYGTNPVCHSSSSAVAGVQSPFIHSLTSFLPSRRYALSFCS